LLLQNIKGISFIERLLQNDLEIISKFIMKHLLNSLKDIDYQFNRSKLVDLLYNLSLTKI